MKRLILSVTALAFLSTSAHAVLLRDRFSLGGGYGVTWAERPGDFRSAYDDAQPAWTGFLGYGIGQDVQVRASYTNMQLETKTGGPGEIMFQPILLSLKIHALHDVPVSPYFLIGAGFADNQIKAPAGAEISWTDFAAQAGVGIEFFFSKEFSLAAEGRYDYIEGDSRVESNYQVASVLALANFYFGPEERTGDKHAAAPPAPTPPPAPAPVNTTVIVQNDNNDEENERLRREADASAASAASSAAASAAAVQKAQQEVEELKARIARKEIQPIMFETGSHRIRATSNETLDEVARIANEDQALDLTVEGHTDNVGDDAANQTLSQGRAEAVKSYLVGQGVSADRITAKGFGESKPVTSNDSEAGREKNRRVEFVFGE